MMFSNNNSILKFGGISDIQTNEYGILSSQQIIKEN